MRGTVVKITNATSLLELQSFVREHEISVRVDYVVSAACYAAVVVGPSKHDETEATSARAIGRTLGEAVASAIDKYEELTR
jgi:hypothetical protein